MAIAVATSDATWIARYAAVALAQAEINERLSRDKWAELAISHGTTVAGALRDIASALATWLSQRDDKIDVAYRKLLRICEALTQTLFLADVPSGQSFGEAFVALVSLGGGGKSAETLRLRDETATSILNFVVQILRLRFDVLFDSDLYRAVGLVRGWWRPARPPKEVDIRADRIAALAMEGLHILARQGVRDTELRRAMTAALGAERVNAVGKEVAAADVSLDPRSSRWLATGQELASSRQSETAQALNEQATDELLARLLLTVAHHDASADALGSVADAINIFEPEHAGAIRRASDRLSLIRQWVDTLANKRGLSLQFFRGEVVQFDPAMHDAAASLQRFSEVRVVVPGVIRSLGDQPSEIVVKALVEKL